MEKKERNNVTWRIGEHSQSKQLNEWCNAQKNIQDSLTNIVMHMMDRFGITDIKDYDIQKILYNETISSNNTSKEIVNKEEIKIKHNDVPKPIVEKTEQTNKENKIKEEVNQEKLKEEPVEDSFYGNADPTNF